MTTNRRRAEVRSARWAGSGPGRRLRVGLAFLGLLAIGLSQVGCQSDGCSTCGGFGSRLKSNVQALNARLFSREGRGCNTCGALGTESGVVVDQGIPITSGEVVVPGAITTPGTVTLPPPGTVVPAPEPEASPELAPIPSSASGAHAPVTSSRLPAVAARGGNLVVANPKRVNTPARVMTSDTAMRAGYSTEEPNLLDQLPPVALPIELTRKANPTDPAEPPRLPPVDSSPVPGVGGAPAPAASATITIPTTSAENRSAGVPAVSGSAPGGGVVIQTTPGIARSAPVGPTVVGGSLPNADGLKWLREKGYRTLVDLRSSGEVDPSFAERVSDGGMLYVALPFAADPIRLDRLTRFTDLLGQNDQRPLYFCDGDGRRAGLLWYLHLRSTDREEQSSARSKAEEVGFNAALDQARAEEFLKGNFPALAPSRKAADATSAPTATAIPDGPTVALTLGLAPESVSQVLDPDPPGLPLVEPTTPIAVAVAVTPAAPVESVAPAPVAPVAVAQAAPARPSPFERATEPSPVPFDRVASWKPMATLVLSGLGVPLAYWSRTNLFPRRGPRRASLTAKGPGPRKSLPSSGA